MKKISFRITILFICLALGLMLTAGVLAASTTKALSTNFTLVNLGATQADVNIGYYKEDGTPWTGSKFPTATLAANGGQVIIRQYFDTLTAGRGSVVIDSNEQLGAVVQILARGQTPTSGAYSGWQQGSSKVYVPLILKRLNTASGLANTQLMIQNTDTTADATVNVNFIATAGSPAPATWSKTGVVIHPGATFYYDLDGETNLNGTGSWYGSAEVDAGSGKVAVVANIFSGPNGLQTFSGFPIEDVGTGWAVPLFTSRLNNGLSTPVTVQNLSGAPIAANGVTLTCKVAPGFGSNFEKKNTSSIPNKGSYAFNPVTDMTFPANWQGSCTLTSGSANVVTYVQMRRPNVTDEIGAFEAFRTNSTDTMVFVPFAGKRLPTASTAITIQNLGSVDAHVRLTYTRSPETSVGNPSYVFSNQVIPANGGQLIENLRLTTHPEIPAGWYGSLMVEDDPGEPTAPQPLVGFVQITDIQGTPGDTFMVYDAFGK